MAEQKNPIGSIAWTDLTIPDAGKVREFYEAVVGWTSSPVEMDGYQDHCVHAPEGGQVVGGICHARGANAELPAQWLLYIVVADLKRSVERCVELGGEVLHTRRDKSGKATFAVIRDPAGAVSALYQQ